MLWRRRCLSSALLVLAAVSCRSTAFGQSEKPATHTVKVDLPYCQAAGETLRLDAYLPADDGPHPAVLVVHGGAWRSGSKSQLTYYAHQLAKSGCAAFAINYRLAPEHKFPAQLEDCQQAVRWIHENARKYHVDAARLGAIGYSAGGHLVAMLGAAGVPLESKQDSSGEAARLLRLKAVCAGGAPCNFENLPENARTLSFWLGGTRAERRELYKQASPISFVTRKSTPIFFFHGAADRIVNVREPQAMVQRLKAAEVPTELYVVEDAGHIMAAANAEAIKRALNFLTVRLEAKPSPTKPQP